jgi:Tfp pilus assembly protein PilE
MTKSKLAIIGVLTVVALAASAVYAGKSRSEDEIDAAMLAKADVTLYQAITAAEQHTQGKAVQAEKVVLEDEAVRTSRSLNAVRAVAVSPAGVRTAFWWIAHETSAGRG